MVALAARTTPISKTARGIAISSLAPPTWEAACVWGSARAEGARLPPSAPTSLRHATADRAPPFATPVVMVSVKEATHAAMLTMENATRGSMAGMESVPRMQIRRTATQFWHHSLAVSMHSMLAYSMLFVHH